MASLALYIGIINPWEAVKDICQCQLAHAIYMEEMAQEYGNEYNLPISSKHARKSNRVHTKSAQTMPLVPVRGCGVNRDVKRHPADTQLG
jgi:hypothetical protein